MTTVLSLQTAPMNVTEYSRTDLRPDAEAAFCRFVRIIRQLIATERLDVMIGAGDSGLSTMAYANIVHACLRRPPPPGVAFPLFRATENWKTVGIDTAPYLSQAAHCFANRAIGNVLFVDDEIGTGGTLRACIELLVSVPASLRRPLRIFVVAEDLYVTLPALPGVELHLLPFGKRPDGISILSRLIPPEFERQVREILHPEEGRSLLWKRATNILLGVPVKAYSDNGPHWNHAYDETINRAIPDFRAKQRAFRTHLAGLVEQAMA